MYDISGGAADGVMAVDLANYTVGNGGIQQTFATIAGSSYNVAFFAGNSLSYGRDGTGEVMIDVANQHFAFTTAVATTSTQVWKSISFSFVADSDFTTLEFYNTQNPQLHFADIDGVSVESSIAVVPEPANYMMLMTGLGMLGFLVRQSKQHAV